MTVIDTHTPLSPQHWPPHGAAVLSVPLADWDGRVDTLPLLRTTDIRSMERLRAIADYALRGIADIDAALDALDGVGAAQVRPGTDARSRSDL